MPELYNLRTDPQEMNNLSPRPEYRSIVERLKSELLAWYKPPELDMPA
jgi:hypothetical protein